MLEAIGAVVDLIFFIAGIVLGWIAYWGPSPIIAHLFMILIVGTFVVYAGYDSESIMMRYGLFLIGGCIISYNVKNLLTSLGIFG